MTVDNHGYEHEDDVVPVFTYSRSVERRVPFCNECLNSLLLVLANRRGKWTAVFFGSTGGKDKTTVDDVGLMNEDSPGARAVVDAVADWFGRTDETHRHKEHFEQAAQIAMEEVDRLSGALRAASEKLGEMSGSALAARSAEEFLK